MKRIFFILFSSFFLHFGIQAADAFEIVHYQIDIDVSNEGYFDVVEKISVDFKEKRRGIFRFIPTSYKINGEEVKIKIDQISVYRDPFKAYNEGRNKVIRIGEEDTFLEGNKEYWIEYRVTGAFLWLEEHTEFYWNLIGTEWEVPILRADYNITFPKNFEIGEYDYEIYSGPEGTNVEKAMVSERDNIIRGRTNAALSAGEGISLAVKLPADAIQNSRQTKTSKSDTGAIIPLGLLGALIFWFRRFGRNRKERIEEYHYPPDELNVSEAATFFDHSASPTDVLAIIPEWGRQGYVRMKGFEDGNSYDYYIEKIAPLPDEAPSYQHELYEGIFKSGPVVLISDLKNTFYSTYIKVQRALKKYVKRDRWMDDQSKQIFHSGWLLGGGFVSIAVAIFLLIQYQLIFSFIALLLLGVSAIIIHFLPVKRSPEGLQLANQVKGLKKFMKRMPEQEVRSLVQQDPNYFEKLFPYAIAFGIDKEFMSHFKTYDFPAPHWYYFGSNQNGYHPVSMNQFSTQFNMKEVQSAFTSSPSTSGSSGGFSGGSSGGGFGGGGGGSW